MPRSFTSDWICRFSRSVPDSSIQAAERKRAGALRARSSKALRKASSRDSALGGGAACASKRPGRLALRTSASSTSSARPLVRDSGIRVGGVIGVADVVMADRARGSVDLTALVAGHAQVEQPQVVDRVAVQA